MEKLWHVCKNVALYYFHYACCMMNVSIQILFSSNKEVKKKKKIVVHLKDVEKWLEDTEVNISVSEVKGDTLSAVYKVCRTCIQFIYNG